MNEIFRVTVGAAILILAADFWHTKYGLLLVCAAYLWNELAKKVDERAMWLRRLGDGDWGREVKIRGGSIEDHFTSVGSEL